MEIVRDVALVETKEAAIARAGDSGDILGVIARLASAPDFDTAKLEKLIELHERTQANTARAAFFSAFADMQAEIPAIHRRGRGDKGTRYALNEDIQKALRPILHKHGFMLTFATKFGDKTVTVTGKLAHKSGHVETAEFTSAADVSGSKNAIQALGSTQSYGQRYTTVALCNITGTDDVVDDDGKSAGKPEPPANYDDLMLAFEESAEHGYSASREAFAALPTPVRLYATKHDAVLLSKIKTRAQKVDKDKAVSK